MVILDRLTQFIQQYDLSKQDNGCYWRLVAVGFHVDGPSLL